MPKPKSHKASPHAAQGEPDLGRAQAAYQLMEPSWAAIRPSEFLSTKTDVSKAAVAAIAVASRVTEPALYARFRSLPKPEFDITHVDNLANLAFACWYAALQDERAQAGCTDAKVPLRLIKQASEVESRMQKCCEYHLGDDPEYSPILTQLSEGTGHRDLAGDLAGYAQVYRRKKDVLEHDTKYYQAQDVATAEKLSEAILDALAQAMSPEASATAQALAKCWVLLNRSYEEVVQTARWLERSNPNRDSLYPSLYAAGRSMRRNAKNAVDTPELPPEPPA